MSTGLIPAGMFLQMWADQRAQETFVDGIKEGIKQYYLNYEGAVEVEASVLNALEVLFDAFGTVSMSVEEVVNEVEDEIAEHPEQYRDSQGKFRKIRTFR